MENIRNKIITISGKTKSGKANIINGKYEQNELGEEVLVKKGLKQIYEDKGYNTHIISVETIFKDTLKKEYLKTHPNQTDVKIEEIQADKEFMNNSINLEKLIEVEIERKGIELNSVSKPNDVYIIDSQTAWKNIPNSFAVRLDDDEKNADENSENYNLIIDTSFANIEEVAQIIEECESMEKGGKTFQKNWASPATFLSCQSARENGTPSCRGNTVEDIINSIKKEGFNQEKACVEIVETTEGVKAISNGNHTCLAVIGAGKTLVPYIVRDDLKKEIDESDISKMYDWIDAIKYYIKKGEVKELENFTDEKFPEHEKILGKVERIRKQNEREL